MKVTIEVKREEGSTETLSFEDRFPITIGRVEENDVVLASSADRVVSGRHARIVEIKGRAVIEDNDSLNGLYVNDQRVSTVDLGAAAVVRLGENGPAIRVTVEGLAPLSPDATIPIPAVSKPKYGERTVGMMIKQALSQAGLVKPPGTSKSTDYFEAMMDRKLERTSSRARWIILGIIVLVIGAGVAVGFYIRHNRSVQYIRNYGDATGSSVAAANRYAIFLLAGKGQYGDHNEGFCTAFAIGANVLATNAHCVKVATEQYRDVQVVMNGAPSNVYSAVRMVAHPQYLDGKISPDVGLVLINGRLSQLATRATPEALSQLGPGIPVFLYGFPGRLNRVEAPEATFISGQIGRITGLDQRHGDFSSNTLIQHSAFSSQGTSGSPIFNGAGQVVGINTGGYVDDGQVMPGYNFAMRIDLIDGLLQGLSR